MTHDWLFVDEQKYTCTKARAKTLLSGLPTWIRRRACKRLIGSDGLPLEDDDGIRTVEDIFAEATAVEQFFAKRWKPSKTGRVIAALSDNPVCLRYHLLSPPE